MLLDDLVACIEVLQERIRSHRASLQANETRTRMALIDPLLQALGWDVSDPAVVAPEYEARRRKADYALLGPDGKPVVILEAKHLGESLENHQTQMLTYANELDIDYAGLTDGDRWELYPVFERGQLEERRLLDVSITGALAHELALNLLLLWRPNLASGRQPTPAATPLLADAPEPTTKPATVEVAQVPGPPEAGWVALSGYNPPAKTGNPTAIRFWDGSERTLGSWRDIVFYTAEKLHAEKRLSDENTPINSGPKRRIVHTEPEHSATQQFKSYKRIEGKPSLYVNVNVSASQARRSANRLLEHCAINPADVHLKVAQ